MKMWTPNKKHWRTYKLLRLGMLVLCTAIPANGAPFQRQPFPPMPTPDAQQAQKPAVLKMRLEEGKITANIVDALLQDVLKELAARTGIIFEVRSQENPLVSVHLNKVSIIEAIQRITSGSNTMFFYGNGPQESEQIRLVRVFPRITTTPQPSILYLGTGAITKSGDSIDTPEQALKSLAESTNIEEREKAIEVLVNTKSNDVIKPLMSVLTDPAAEIRVAAIEGLAVLNAHNALPDILKSLKDPNPAVRQSATTAVALLGDAQNVKDLKPLTADKDAGVAAAADMAMRKLSSAAKKQ
jgi:hypothetical protein